jgi:hypothetical protein
MAANSVYTDQEALHINGFDQFQNSRNVVTLLFNALLAKEHAQFRKKGTDNMHRAFYTVA